MKDRTFYTIVSIAVALILLVGIFSISYYLKFTRDECLAEPFVYGAKLLEERYTVKVHGSVSIMNHPEVRIYFNSNNITIENDNQKNVPFITGDFSEEKTNKN